MVVEPYASFETPPDLRWMDEASLVTALQQGDACAAEWVVQRYAPALYRYAYYQLQDATLAEDLVAEVLLRLVAHLDDFGHTTSPLEAWLFCIAHNLVVDHYRVRKRRPQISLEHWLGVVPDGEPTVPDSQIDGLPEREELKAGLAQLTAEQRHVILLHVVEGWELPQVARLLDRTLPSVKSLYYRGLQGLRRALTRRQPSGRPLRQWLPAFKDGNGDV
ncbi:MAG TPA: RNA polymerase sigma factor [Chloroflexia bacterium]|nr:RNA polymerase sigma factor [Chloroflexia bacterium]